MIIIKFLEFAEYWDEESTIQGVKNKDNKSITKLWNQYYPIFLGKLRSMKTGLNDDDLDQVASDSIGKAINKIDQSGKGSFNGWMFTILRNTLYDLIRAPKGKKAKPILKDEMPSGVSSTNTEYSELTNQMKDKFEIFSKGLSEMSRKIIRLYLDGYTHKEIAKEVGKSEGNSKWHVNQVMNKFKDWYVLNKSI